MWLRAYIGGRLARGAAGESFFAWWGRSLAAWIPPAWRRALGMDRGRILLQVQDERLLLRLERTSQGLELDPVPLADACVAGVDGLLPREFSDLPRWLLLPASAGLRRRLVLPAAARERLREVAGYEVDRQTPFAVDSVAHDIRFLGRRGSEGDIEAELVVVPRAALADRLEAIGEAGVSLAGIDLADRDGAATGVNLLAPAARRQQHGANRGLNVALAAVSLVALWWAMALLLDNRRIALDALQAQADDRVRAARQVTLQRRELVDLAEGRDFVERLRRERPAAIEVMDHLAQRLPDDTYLERLSMDGEKVSLVGFSGAASSLVGRLTGAGPLRSPALTGVLQPDPASGRERFTLVAELAGGDGDAHHP